MSAAPRIGFVIGGVQKGGTTALARFVSRHPALQLPDCKEAHVFDSPDFDESWGVEQIDECYGEYFPDGWHPEMLYGDATPIYCLHPHFVRRIAAYNPDMRWIVILRHPVERAISQYRMERARANESWPLWPAMLLERWRLRAHQEDFSADSPLRRLSYRLRSDYARQLDVLYAHFPESQVLLLRNEQLAADPASTMAAIWRFLGLPAPAGSAAFERVFEGDYRRPERGTATWRMLSWLLRSEMARSRRRYGIDWR